MAAYRKKKAAPFEPRADHPVILLHGREPFLMRERTRQVEEVLREAHGEVQVFTFDGGSVDLATVLDELRSYGLLQEYKLVIVDKVDEFLTGQDSRRDAMERYVKQPVDHATLLLRGETWRPSKLDKLIAEVGLVHKVEAVDESIAATWLGARCKKRYGTTIEPDAARALVSQIGPDLDRLDTELGKLASFVGDRPVTVNDVSELVGLSREQQAWVIQSALVSGDTEHALTTLRELLSVSRHPEQLITWAINDILKKLHAASRMREEGMAPGIIARELKLWGDSRNLVLDAADRCDPKVIAQLLHESIETDWRSKRGVGDAARSLETLSVLVTDTIRLGSLRTASA